MVFLSPEPLQWYRFYLGGPGWIGSLLVAVRASLSTRRVHEKEVEL
jgi:hypothetical protein